MVRFAILLAALRSSVAFTVIPSSSQMHQATGTHIGSSSSSCLFMSEPSDTSSDDYDDDFVTVESEPYEPTREEALVSNVLDLIPSTFGEVSSETRSAINEAIYQLESVNPTSEPTMSPLLNGVWELRYSGGYTEEFALPSPTVRHQSFVYCNH